MAERFHQHWIGTLTDYADKAAKTQNKQDFRRLSSEITKEVNRMKSYERYVEKTYGTAGKEENSLELEFLRKAQRQLLGVRDQLQQKMKDPSSTRVSYYKILNLEKESAAKFEAYISEQVKEQPTTTRAQEVKAHAAANIDNIFIDMFQKTKRTDFQMLGKALNQATNLLTKYGYNITDEVKKRMVDNYEQLSSDTAFQIILDVRNDISDRITEKKKQKATEQELRDLDEALKILRGAM